MVGQAMEGVEDLSEIRLTPCAQAVDACIPLVIL
jgi:hypothetical protein